MDAGGYFDPSSGGFTNGGFDAFALPQQLGPSRPPGYTAAGGSGNGWFNFAAPNQGSLTSSVPFGHVPPTALGMTGADPTAMESIGWGGQMIPDNSGYRVPWFGRTKGKSGNGRGGRGGRGRQGNNNNEHQQHQRNGHGSNRSQWNRQRRSHEGTSTASDDILTVEDVMRLVRSVPENAPLSSDIYQNIRHFDSRTCSVLLKDLSKLGLCSRAIEVFDHMRSTTVFNSSQNELRHLCDVYTYTAMISMCIYQQDVDRALGLVDEMHQRQIERNVHTYTALMNVCIKCGKCQLALDSYRHMREDGIAPNVVTYNTLIDIYGKMGQWEQAVKVLVDMKCEGVDAVLRTYNTLIISCNMCNQPREALAVYNRLLAEGFSPNATTYNALISAYGKAGQLDKVMEVFQDMLWKGCERSVITYSSLISACEKAGQWEIALDLFTEMQREGCIPNTVTYNSLITACAQGAQWEKACEVFDQMRVQGCAPDVVTYTALISANERGGQWRRALQAYEDMLHQGCRPDAIVYNAIIDAVWETGVIWAQRKALAIFESAQSQGHFKQQPVHHVHRAEVNLHALTAGVAVLSLYSWVVELKKLVLHEGANALPAQLCIVTDKGRSSKEQGNLVVKEAVAAMMNTWEAPFRPMQDSVYAGMLEATGTDAAEWLMSTQFEEHLFGFFPCSNIIPSTANTLPFEEGLSREEVGLNDDVNFTNEIAVESRCIEAFAAVHHFESSHSLTLQAMGLFYLQHRANLVQQLFRYGQELNLREEVAHDAVLLMDRAMSTSFQIKEDLLELLSVGCLVLAMKQTEKIDDLPSDETLEQVTDCKTSAVAKMEWNLRQVLGSDTSAISTLRCIMLYLERLGSHLLDPASVDEVSGRAVALVEKSMSDLTFLNCRPSVVAAAILYAERRSRGVIPFWPSMLAKLTGYQDMSSPELTVAIRGAQKLCQCLSPSNIPQPEASIANLALLSPATMDISAAPIQTASLLMHTASANELMSPVGQQTLNFGLLQLEPSTIDSLNRLNSVPAINPSQPATLASSRSVNDDQVTANRVDGVIVSHGATAPPRVMQGLSHVTSGFPSILPTSSGLLGSNAASTRMNTNAFRVVASGGVPITDVTEN